MLEVQSLQEKVDDIRDKEIIRTLKKELDELKFKFDGNENDVEELVREKVDLLLKINIDYMYVMF